MAILLAAIVAIMGQSPARPTVPVRPAAPARLPRLDKAESKRVLRDAERQLAQYVLSHPRAPGPLVVRTLPKKGQLSPASYGGQSGGATYVEHRGNPLTDRIATFRCRFKRVAQSDDMIPQEIDASAFVPTIPVRADHAHPTQSYVIVATVNANLGALYPSQPVGVAAKDEELRRLEDSLVNVRASIREIKNYGRSYRGANNRNTSLLKRQERSLKRNINKVKADRGKILGAHRKQLSSLRHEIRLLIPAGIRPVDVPAFFDATVGVISVQWDTRSKIPTFVIYAQLIKSVQLGIDLTLRKVP